MSADRFYFAVSVLTLGVVNRQCASLRSHQKCDSQQGICGVTSLLGTRLLTALLCCALHHWQVIHKGGCKVLLPGLTMAF